MTKGLTILALMCSISACSKAEGETKNNILRGYIVDKQAKNSHFTTIAVLENKCVLSVEVIQTGKEKANVVPLQISCDQLSNKPINNQISSINVNFSDIKNGKLLEFPVAGPALIMKEIPYTTHLKFWEKQNR